MTPHDAMPLVKIATAMAAPEIVLFRMVSGEKKAVDVNIDRTYRVVDKHLLQPTLHSILDSRRSAISTYLSLACNTFFPAAGVLYFLVGVRTLALAPIRSLDLALSITTPGWSIVMFVAVVVDYTLHKYRTETAAFRRET